MVSPYSLGKLIEWKLIKPLFSLTLLLCPYSLGKLIEWKLPQQLVRWLPQQLGPYSLGKLIEWKHDKYF